MATKIHAVLRPREIAVTPEFCRDIGIVVIHTVPVNRVMNPGIATAAVDIVDVPVDVDVAVVPVDAATPIAARRPAPERVGGAKCEPCADHAGGNIARWRPVIGGIGRIGPCAINDSGIVIGHV